MALCPASTLLPIDVAYKGPPRQARLGGRDGLYTSNTVTNSEAIRQVFRHWAQILAARLGQVHALPHQAAASENGAP